MTMRHETAVSEVIGAVLLISIVMLSMAIIGVIMLSTPPPDKTPKASLTSYCIRCNLTGDYEIILYHGGGESMTQDQIKFILYLEDGSSKEIIPWWVYEGTPEDCMFSDIGDSSLSSREYWNTVKEWKSGQTLRFRENFSSKPIGMDIQYYPFKSPMVKVNFKEQIKDAPCVKDSNSCKDPTHELIPVLVNPRKKGDPGCNPAGCDDGSCYAQFKYQLHSDSDTDNYHIPVQQREKPWNYFIGNMSVVVHEDFNNTGNMSDIITVYFFNEVQWWLGRTKSEIARCE